MEEPVQHGQNPSDRDTKGRFTQGNTIGVTGGRPKVWNKAEYLTAIQEEVTPEEWKKIVMQAVRDAYEGQPKDRVAAREWLGKYLLPQKTEVEITGGESPVKIIAVEGFEGWEEKLKE